MEHDDDDVELAWKAALDADEPLGRGHDGADDEDDELARLDEALGYAASASSHAEGTSGLSTEVEEEAGHPGVHDVHDSTHHQDTGANTIEIDRDAEHGGASIDEATVGRQRGRRYKRKNFDKTLQLLCLQRYADHAREFGKLPDHNETVLLLDQSHRQFVEDGGAPDEPHLTPPEFLKMIRNRRREIHTRSQPLYEVLPKRSGKKRGRYSTTTVAKRKLQEENEKIRELVEAIDRANGRPKQSKRRHTGSRASLLTEGPTSDKRPPGDDSAVTVQLESQEQMNAILRIQQQTRAVQREIQERIRSIQGIIHHLDNMEEPASASV